MVKVFLSSTFQDLQAERKAVEAAIHRMSANYIGMEHFGSFSSEPIVKSLEKVRACDVLVLVLADRYGYLPEGSTISITEAEYQEARQVKLPILAYFRQEDMRTLGSEKREIPDTRLVLFKEVVQESHGITWFSGPEDLAWKVAADLARELRSAAGESLTIEQARNAVLYDPIRDRMGELVSILEQRAENIEANLRRFYRYAKVEKYLASFKSLHKKHVQSLRTGNVIQAHELLTQIHKLSADLESDEFWKSHHAERPSTLYRLRTDAFERGRMVCEYVVGDMTSYSERYPSHKGFSAYVRGNDNCSPIVSARLYQEILGDSEPGAL